MYFSSMAKTFRPYALDQQLLLPPDQRSWLPEGHLALYRGAHILVMVR